MPNLLFLFCMADNLAHHILGSETGTNTSPGCQYKRQVLLDLCDASIKCLRSYFASTYINISSISKFHSIVMVPTV